MSTISVIWIVVFAVATLLFFAAAAVITVLGTRDLKDLLKKTKSKSPRDE